MGNFNFGRDRAGSGFDRDPECLNIFRGEKLLYEVNRTQESFWWQLNLLILTFIFKIDDFAHFFVDLQPIRRTFEKERPI
jgi:hypothetical protein